MADLEELAGQGSGRAGRLAPLPQRPAPGFGEVLANGSNAEESPAPLSSLLPPGHLSSSAGSGAFEPAHGPEAGAQDKSSSGMKPEADTSDSQQALAKRPLVLPPPLMIDSPNDVESANINKTPPGEPPKRLDIQRLKERVELEVDLVKEGFRAIVFLAFCACFFTTIFLIAKPELRSDSVHEISHILGLDSANDVQVRAQVFGTIKEISSNARFFAPMSSDHCGIQDQQLIDHAVSFPLGSKTLPMEFVPSLALDWTLSFRLRIPSRVAQPVLLFQEVTYLSNQEKLLCWALHTEGMRKYTLTFGQNNHDDGYTTVTVEFDPVKSVDLDISEMNLVAVLVDSTSAQFRVYLQNGDMGAPSGIGYQVASFPAKAVPAQCLGGVIEIGNEAVELSDAKIHNRLISDITEITDIAEAGQPLVDIAMGVATGKAPELILTGSSQAATSDDSLDNLLGIVKMSASISNPNSSSDQCVPMHNKPAPRTEDDALPRVPLRAGQTWKDVASRNFPVHWPIIGDEEEYLWGLSDGEPVLRWNKNIADGLTAAFQGLRQDEIREFTLSWWAKRVTSSETVALMWIMPEDASDVSLFGSNITVAAPIFTVTFSVDKQIWQLKLHGGQDCASENTCNVAAAVDCKGPDNLVGRWSHTALRFGQGTLDDGLGSEFELFVDGQSVCGLKFPAAKAHGLHLSDPQHPDQVISALVVENPSLENEWNELALIRNMRLYNKMLDREIIDALGTDPEWLECMDLRINSNSHDFATSFGQTCDSIAELKSSVEDFQAACSTSEVATNCIQSCDDSPVCWDGVPQLHKPPTAPYMPFRDAHFLNNAADFLDSEGQMWHRLWKGIERVEKGQLIAAEDSCCEDLFQSQRFWRMDSPDNNTLCTDAANAIENREISMDEKDYKTYGFSQIAKICAADMSHHSTVLPQLSYYADWNLAWQGEDKEGFEKDLLQLGKSATIMFWARPLDGNDIDSIGLSGVDEDKNVCFFANGREGGSLPINASTAVPEGAPHPHIQLPKVGHRKSGWAFFALVFDARNNQTTYMVNQAVQTIQYDPMSSGCQRLTALVVTGKSMALAPVRIAGKALSVGSLQRVRMHAQTNVFSKVQAPRQSQLSRLKGIEIETSPFSSLTVAMSPPIILQKRTMYTAPSEDDSDSGLCNENSTASYIVAALSKLQGEKCSAPNSCNLTPRTNITSLCWKASEETPAQFFGRLPTYYKGSLVFPEFTWILENPSVVRSGENLAPGEDYIDPMTKSVTLLMTFFTTTSQVATIVEVTFDMASARVMADVNFQQVMLESRDGYIQFLTWASISIFLIILFGLLAIPAAMEELKSILQFMTFKNANRIMPAVMKDRSPAGREERKHLLRQSLNAAGAGLEPKPRGLKAVRKAVRSTTKFVVPNRYTHDTTQPDLFDVLLALVFVVYIAFMMRIQHSQIDSAPEVFGEMAQIDWSEKNIPFNDKVNLFLLKATDVLDLVAEDDQMVTIAFWLLVICALRIIVFMNVHPHICGVYQAFKLVGVEILNFTFSFGIIYVFLAFIAYIRFGYQYEGFRSMTNAMTTQFSILVGDEIPNYRDDTLMCTYVIGYVFICTLALLNFLLAIVVNGYTIVSEAALEIKVAISLPVDILIVITDAFRWIRHSKWPSKRILLNILATEYDFIKGAVAKKEGMTCQEFTALLCSYVPVPEEEAKLLFRHYSRWPCLTLEEDEDKE